MRKRDVWLAGEVLSAPASASTRCDRRAISARNGDSSASHAIMRSSALARADSGPGTHRASTTLVTLRTLATGIRSTRAAASAWT
jgi:hypothetical protein